ALLMRTFARRKAKLTRSRAMETFRIDESGYTGFRLLNVEQPFQGACAIAIEEDDAQRLIKEHFPRMKAEELKYRRLIRRENSYTRLLALHADLLTHYKCVTLLCDKRYLLIMLFLSYAKEPWCYERGTNLYADGRDLALASLLYYTGRPLLGKEAFERILICFQDAVKEKTPSTGSRLVEAVRASDWRQLPEILGPLGRDASPECLEAIATPGVTTDAAFIVLQALISRMEAMAEGPYCIEHDQSNNLQTYHDLLQSFIGHKEVATFRQSDVASMSFPLKLTSVIQVDSKNSPAVQLADVMIGMAIDAMAAITKTRTATIDPHKVISGYASDQLIHMIPTRDFVAHRQAHQGSQAADLVDYIGKNFAKSFPGALG
ncbi:DUF3800 domain-containing protein, partial [Xanthomonas vesicatoria]